MNRYLNYYLDDGFFLRVKNIVLTEYYMSGNHDLYLGLRCIDGYDHDSSTFDGFDIQLDEFVLKLRNDSVESRFSIALSFEQYLSELEPATIVFNKANGFDLFHHNGADYDEGWFSHFGSFVYQSFTLYTCADLKGSYYQSAEAFRACSAMLHTLRNKHLDVYDWQLLEPKFNRLIRLLRLCVAESVAETIAFLNGYYVLRPDLDSVRSRYGLEFDDALTLASEIIDRLESIDQTTF